MQVHQSVFCFNVYIHRAEYYLFHLQFLLILKQSSAVIKQGSTKLPEGIQYFSVCFFSSYSDKEWSK